MSEKTIALVTGVNKGIELEDDFGRLDVLVSNAGIVGRWPDAPTTLTPEDVRTVLETNVIGPIRVTNALLPLLRHSAHPRVINQSSHLSSLTQNLGEVSGAYAPSKTFLNALTVQYAKELKGSGILINSACPGYVANDFNGFHGTRTPEEGAAITVRLATLPDDGPTGQPFDDSGVVPW